MGAEQPGPILSAESQPVMPVLWLLLDAMGLAEGHPLRDLLEDREAKGLATYGTVLHTYNGRDALRDCAEELADALAYTVQWALEGGDESQYAEWIRRLLRLAGEVAQAAAVVGP